MLAHTHTHKHMHARALTHTHTHTHAHTHTHTMNWPCTDTGWWRGHTVCWGQYHEGHSHTGPLKRRKDDSAESFRNKMPKFAEQFVLGTKKEAVSMHTKEVALQLLPFLIFPHTFLNLKTGLFNPFTAPACKISRLKSAHIHACKQYIWWSYTKSTFNTVHFDRNLFPCSYEGGEKALVISNLALLLVIFRVMVRQAWLWVNLIFLPNSKSCTGGENCIVAPDSWVRHCAECVKYEEV